MTDHSEDRKPVRPHDTVAAAQPVSKVDVDSSKTDGEGNGQTASDAVEQGGSGRVPGADGERGQALSASASVPRDDWVEGEEAFVQPMCIPCPGASSAK